MADEKTPQEWLKIAQNFFGFLSQANPQIPNPHITEGTGLHSYFRLGGDAMKLQKEMRELLVHADADVTAFNAPGEHKTAVQIEATIAALTKDADIEYAVFLYNKVKTGRFTASEDSPDYCSTTAIEDDVNWQIKEIKSHLKRAGKVDSQGEADLKVLEPEGGEYAVRKVFQSAFIREARRDLGYLQHGTEWPFGEQSWEDMNVLTFIRSLIKQANDVCPENKVSLATIDLDGKKTDSEMAKEIVTTEKDWHIKWAREAFDMIAHYAVYSTTRTTDNRPEYLPSEDIKTLRDQIAKHIAKAGVGYEVFDQKNKRTSEEMSAYLFESCKTAHLNSVQRLFIMLQEPDGGGADREMFGRKMSNLIKQIDKELNMRGFDSDTPGGLPLTALNRLGENRTVDEIKAIMNDALQSNALRNAKELVDQSREKEVTPLERIANIDYSPEGLRKAIRDTLKEGGFEVKEEATTEEMAKDIAKIIKDRADAREMAEQGEALRALGLMYSPTNSPAKSPTINDVVLPLRVILSPTNSPTTNGEFLLPPGTPVKSPRQL